MSGSEPVVIVDYGVGNLGSIANMLKKAGVDNRISAEPSEIRRADRLILAGVGAFDNGMRNLADRGLIDVLNEKAATGTPILGLCLGMQLMGRTSEEGTLPGLGWIDARAKRFRPAPGTDLKVPHMGWNTVRPLRTHRLLKDLDDGSRFYFVHSYYVECADPAVELGRTTYGHEFCSAMAAGNLTGVQFHPEKSHRFGLALLSNFARNSV